MVTERLELTPVGCWPGAVTPWASVGKFLSEIVGGTDNGNSVGCHIKG